MCPHCADGLDQGLTRRTRALHLLAIIAYPRALPAPAVLRLGQEFLTWIAEDKSNHRCDDLVAGETRTETAV
jgi:hypothetical protein